MDREPSDVPQVGEHNTRRRGGGERREGEGRQPQRHAAQPCVLHQKCCEQTLLRPYFTLGWANVPLTKLIPRQSLCTFEDFWVKLAALPRRALLPSYFLFHFLGNARVARKRHFSPFLPSPRPPLPRPAPRYTAPSPPLLNRRRCNNSSPRLSPVNQHIATRLCVPFRSIFIAVRAFLFLRLEMILLDFESILFHFHDSLKEQGSSFNFFFINRNISFCLKVERV